MGNGFAALMGMLKGSEGLPEGMIAADKTRQGDEALAESKRHAQVLEGQLNTPIGSLYDTLGLPTPQGVDPTKSVPTALLPHAYGALEKEQARKAAAEKASYLDQALGKAAIDNGTKGTAPREGAMAEPEAAGTMPATTVTPHPGISLLRTLIPGLDAEKITPTVTELVKELAPGGGQVTPHQALGNGDTYVYGTNKAGDIVKPPKALGIGAPESRNADLQSIRAGMVAEGWDQGKPTFDIELRRRFAASRPVMAPPGSQLMDRDSFAGSGPKPVYNNPANPPESAIKDAGDRNNIIQQLEGTADLVRRMPQLQTATGRGMLAARAFIQGRTPWETLTPEEQAYTVTHENLRQMLIQAQMGLGPFRSPEMQAQLKDTIGRFWTPGTDARLTALAQLLRGQQQNIYRGEQAGNVKPVHQPPAAYAASVVKWGRDAQGNPVRLQ